MFPGRVGVGQGGDIDEWAPFRAFGFAEQFHADFGGKPVGFARVARQTAANDVLPSGHAAAVARGDVIEVEIGAFEFLAAILAGVVVTLENVVTRELYFLARETIKHLQQDQARDTDASGNSADGISAVVKPREVAPLIEVEGPKFAIAFFEDDGSVSFVNERESTADGANIDRLPEAVEHQDLLVQR